MFFLQPYRAGGPPVALMGLYTWLAQSDNGINMADNHAGLWISSSCLGARTSCIDSFRGSHPIGYCHRAEQEETPTRKYITLVAGITGNLPLFLHRLR